MDDDIPVGLDARAWEFFPEKLWDVTAQELNLARSLARDCPENGNQLIDRVHAAGCGDMFPYLSEKDLKHISEDGKIPRHERWADRLKSGEVAIDTLLNLAGIASFTTDQQQLDARIEKIIGA